MGRQIRIREEMQLVEKEQLEQLEEFAAIERDLGADTDGDDLESFLADHRRERRRGGDWWDDADAW